MNKQEMPFDNLDLPKVERNQAHKQLLKATLLSAHQQRTGLQILSSAIGDVFSSISTSHRGLTYSVLTVAVLLLIAGTLGPSASSVAQAQAQENINRAFVRLASLPEDELAELQTTFQGKMLFKHGSEGGFIAMNNLDSEDAEVKFRQRQASLTDILAEAKAASDLRIVSADEMPMPGFFGRAGRAIGLKMMHRTADFEAKIASLPEDVRQKVGEQRAVHEESRPASFMVFTNADGQTVYLGLNANDEPVMVLVTSGDNELPSSPQGKRMIFDSNGVEIEQGERMYLKSRGDKLPGGEGKFLFDENGEPR
jgi:hypothetical protein